MWLFVLFVTVPIIEIALFIQIGGLIGLWPTLGIVVLTAFLGTMLVRSQGLMALAEVRSNLNELRDPTESLAHGAMILASGLLLLTPGFFTDFVGFMLLVPTVRAAVFRWVRARVKVQSFVHTEQHYSHRSGAPRDGQVIDGEYSDLDEDDIQPSRQPGQPPSGWTRH
ncbi:MAG: FxsA family protein [Paracoccaceae bacterium]